MEKQITVWIGAVLLLAVLNCSEAQVIPKYFVDGGTLTLRPDVTETITNILWKYNGNLVAEWVQGEVELFYYEKYKNRTTLNTATGQLVIEHMKKGDVGLYTVEINNKVHRQSYNVKWITSVPKPSVKFRPLICGPKSESCNVTCDGQESGSLGDAEPIEYRWKIGEKDWKTMTKDITITSAETQTEPIKTISCQMKNPVGQEDSDPEVNPMYTELEPTASPVGGIIGGIIGGLALVLTLVGIWVWKSKPELIPAWVPKCGGGNDIVCTGVVKDPGPAHEDPNNSSGAQTNNSSGAQPDKTSEHIPLSSPDPPADSSTTDKSSEHEPLNSTNPPADTPAN